MAKSKLTKNAIRFIIQKREDWYVNYTFDDIAKLLKQEFDISVTEQGVSKSYRKHKDDKYFHSGQLVAHNGDTEVVSKKEKYECGVRSIGRSIRYPFEVPVATVFGVVGTVVFLWLLLRAPSES